MEPVTIFGCQLTAGNGRGRRRPSRSRPEEAGDQASPQGVAGPTPRDTACHCASAGTPRDTGFSCASAGSPPKTSTFRLCCLQAAAAAAAAGQASPVPAAAASAGGSANAGKRRRTGAAAAAPAVELVSSVDQFSLRTVTTDAADSCARSRGTKEMINPVFLPAYRLLS